MDSIVLMQSRISSLHPDVAPARHVRAQHPTVCPTIQFHDRKVSSRPSENDLQLGYKVVWKVSVSSVSGSRVGSEGGEPKDPSTHGHGPRIVHSRLRFNPDS